MTDEFTKVVVLEHDIEAQLLDSILEERGIPHLLVSYHDTAYDGLFQTQKGWGCVKAPFDYHQEIQEILHDVRVEASKEEVLSEDPPEEE